VKRNKAADGPARREEPAQTLIGEDPLDEVFAQDRIREPPLLLDRQVGNRSSSAAA
jgi:hypothetical protein